MPKKVDIDKQREKISHAAIQVINQNGLDSTRLRDVARTANVTTGAITHYFDSKDAVLEAALSEVVRRTIEGIDNEGRLQTPGAIGEFIERACFYLPTTAQTTTEWRVWLAFWGRAITDERLRAINRTYYEGFVNRMMKSLQALRKPIGPAAPAKDTRVCADAFLAAIDGIGTRATLEPEQWPITRQKETLTKLLTPLLNEFINQ